MDPCWICHHCGEKLSKGNELSHECFETAEELYQVGDTNRLTANTIRFIGHNKENLTLVGENKVEHTQPDIDNLEFLINEVFVRPPLWDHRLPLASRGRRIKERLWREIFVALQQHFSTLEDIQIKWRSLRDRCIKEFNDQKKTSGAAAEYKQKWKYFEQMLFLKDIITTRKTISTVPSSELPECSGLQPGVAHQSTPSSSHKRRKTDDPLDAMACKLMQDLQKPAYVPDEVDAFCTRLAAGLRKLPSRKRQLLEINFLQQILEAEDE